MKILKETFRYGLTTLLQSIDAANRNVLVQSNVFDPTGGTLVIDRVDSNGMTTPSAREFITFNGSVLDMNGVQHLVDVQRGMYGSTAKAHSTGAIIEALPILQEEIVKSREQYTLETYLKKLL